MISKKNLIELLSKEDDDLEIECNVDVESGVDYKGDYTKGFIEKRKFTIKFTIIKK